MILSDSHFCKICPSDQRKIHWRSPCRQEQKPIRKQIALDRVRHHFALDWHVTLDIFYLSVSDGTRADSRNTDHLSLLNQLPLSSWTKSPSDVGKILNASHIKIQIDSSKPLIRIDQYPVSKKNPSRCKTHNRL